MKLLLIAGYYPPNCPISATRAPKLARFFLERGHDVRVLAPRRKEYPEVLKNEIPDERVIYTPMSYVAEWPDRVIAALRPGGNAAAPEGANDGDTKPAPAPASAAPPRGPQIPSLKTRLGNLYRHLACLPDPSIGWRRHALAAGRTLMRDWRPNLIYASVPPHTGLLVAAALSRQFGVPWVPEFRDLWTDHPYYDDPPPRRWIERALERRALKSAAAMVTVTAGWRDHLAALWPQPVHLAMNGFEPAEFADAPRPPARDGPLTILYAGGIYPGRRDPSALFRAVALLGARAADIRVDFYGTQRDIVEGLATEHGVSASVAVHDAIAREAVLEHEKSADALLLLRWDHPGENAVLAGKLFEYIGAGRPILSVGSTAGEAATIIRDNGLGLVSSDPEEIAATLGRWLEAKKTGGVPAPAGADLEKFTRPHQFAGLEKFLQSIM